MSEPAKDEAELAEVMAMAMAKHFSMNNAPHMSGNPLNRLGALELRRLNDATNAALAAIRAAGWVVVPVEPTEEMRRATWEAQYRFVNSGLSNPKQEEVVQEFVRARMNAPRQRKQDHLAYAAMLAAAPGVKP